MVSIISIGQIHENAAKRAIGDYSVNSNSNINLKDIKLKGNNYPVYDIFSSSEVCSVKVRTKGNGEANIQSYKHEFLRMLGWGRAYDGGLSPLQQDADRIIDCGKLGIPIPEALRDAKTEKVVTYLQEHSTMRVPSDHVDSVRSALIKDAKVCPEKYFLPPNPTESQFKNLANRIQSTGISYAESLKLAHSPQCNIKNSEKIVVNNNVFSDQTHQEINKSSREKINAFTKAIKSHDNDTIKINSLDRSQDRIEESIQDQSTKNSIQSNRKRLR